MPKLITVIGATGIQGGSVARTLLADSTYIVRAVTRNPESAAAVSLRTQGAEIVQADLDDVTSLAAAVDGSYAIFAVTNFFEAFPTAGAVRAQETESTHGINLAKAAAATPTLQHYIWSTLPNASEVSNGRCFIPHYAAKNKVDSYIRSDPELLSKTTFLWVSFYASNLQYPFYEPFPVATAGSNKYAQIQATPPSVPITLVGDARSNVGLFAKSILDQPQMTLPAKIVLASTDEMTAGELLSLWASIHGKDAVYVQADKDTYYSMWPMWAEIMDASHMYWELAQEKSYSSEGQVVLTRQDLGVFGLVDTATAIARTRN